MYLIPGTTAAGQVLVCGYYRINVAQEGDKILSVTPFSKSCLVIRSEGQPGRKPVAAVFSHLVTEAPVETDPCCCMTGG